MPRKTPDLDLDFAIYVDGSCLSEAMDDETHTTMPPSPDVTPAADQVTTENAQEHTNTATDELPSVGTDNVAEMAGEQEKDTEQTEESEVERVESATPELDEVTEEDKAAAETEVEIPTEPAAEDAPVTDKATLQPEAIEGEHEDTVSAEEVAGGEEANNRTAEDVHPDQEVQDVDANVEEQQHQRTPGVDRKTSLRTEALIHAAARAVVAKIERRSSDPPAEQEEDEFDNSLLSTDSQDTPTHRLDDDAHNTYGDHEPPSRRQSSDSPSRHMPSRSISSDDAGDSSSHNEPDDDVFSDRSARSSLCSLDARDLDQDMHIKTPLAKPTMSRRDSYASTTTTGTNTHSPRNISNISTISALSSFSHYPEKFTPTTRETRLPFRTPSEIRAMQMSSPTPSVFNGSSPRSSPKRNHHHHQPPPISRLTSPAPSAQYSPKGRTPPRFKPPRKDPAPLVLLHVTLLPLRWPWGDVLNTLDTLPSSKHSDPQEEHHDLHRLRDAWRALQDRVGDTVLERGILLPHPQGDYEVLEERLLEALELPVRRRARILECGHYVGPGGYEDDFLAGEGSDCEEEGGQVGKRRWCGTCRNEIRVEELGEGRRVFRVKVYASNGLMRAGAWEACWKEMERVDVEVEPVVEIGVQGELERLGVMQMEAEEQRRLEMEAAELEAELKREAAVLGLRAETPALHQADSADLDAQRAMMSSPAPSAAMQLTSLVRASTPAPAVHQAEPIDTSDERRRRDEERMREIYGDMPSSAPAPSPPDHQYQSAAPTHSQALTAVNPPPMPLLTDGTRQQHHPDPYTAPRPPAEDAYPRTHNQPNPARSSRVVLDENSGFVELLMEAFKVLLRDPKNVAIIVLCLFLMVMMKRPAAGETSQLVPAVVPAGYRFEPVAAGEVHEVRVEGVEAKGIPAEVEAVVVEMAVEVPVVAGLEAPVVDVVEEAVVVEEVAVEEEAVVVEGPEVQVVVEEGLEEEVGTQGDDVVLEPVLTVEPDTLPPLLAADVCHPRGLEYPFTMVGELPDSEVADDATSFNTEAEVEAEQTVLEDSPVTQDEVDATASNIDIESPTLDNTADLAKESGTHVTQPDEADSNADEDLADRCNMDTDPEYDEEDLSPTRTATASTTSLFIPGPYVTERKTVRVFETVTETVRVSVVTETETVSTVVTAVPQTVEETVFETETVRITVSVPVEEQQGKGKVKEVKAGCKKGKGWF